MIDRSSSVPWTSQEWCAYFRSNATAPRDIPWERGAEVSPEELAAIASSVQGFQLGESSEGRHLFNSATTYAIREEDAAYREAMALFIGEEQRHARELGRFLSLAGIPLISRTWPDTVFRWLRHRAGLELSIAVLLTAEIIAKVYYAALREATGSSVLKGLCDHILTDEKEHVRFQCERLAILRQRRPTYRLFSWHAWQRTLFWGTCFVVWWKHGRAIKAGKVRFRCFWSRAWGEFNIALRAMDPRGYTFEAAGGAPELPLESVTRALSG